MHRKLESWAQQYTALLSSGLEDQRQHFEQRLLELRASYPTATMTGEQVRPRQLNLLHPPLLAD